MKLLVINNIASGYGNVRVYDFMRAFSQDGDEVCLRSSDGTTDIATLVADAADFDAVVAAGGDGTIAAISYLLAGTGVPILPFPAGTANLITSNLNSPAEPYALAQMVRDGRTLDFDLGEISVEGKRFGFEMIAGAGYDAAIMRTAAQSKPVLGQMAYVSAAITHALPTRSLLTVTMDGEVVERTGLGVLLVNFSQLQYDISVTHENEPRDGAFDVVILKAHNAFELIPAVIAAARDKNGDYPDRGDALEIFRARQVSVLADPPLEVQYDGEPTGLSTPFSAQVLPGATTFFVSKEGYRAFEDAGQDA